MRRWVVVLRRILTDRNISDQKISETVSLVVNFLRFLVVKKVYELRSFSFLLGKRRGIIHREFMIRWTQINTCAEAVKIFSSRFFFALG